jgi:hypothetical protein
MGEGGSFRGVNLLVFVGLRCVGVIRLLFLIGLLHLIGV